MTQNALLGIDAKHMYKRILTGFNFGILRINGLWKGYRILFCHFFIRLKKNPNKHIDTAFVLSSTVWLHSLRGGMMKCFVLNTFYRWKVHTKWISHKVIFKRMYAALLFWTKIKLKWTEKISNIVQLIHSFLIF